ncbi:MAG: branched-chain amino acid ABC transporter permease [Deltaproteobacteria bacterium]|nr:branched-chain amino acid ABC transporter permease [Deltaproteobacteria bacterium]
MSDLTMYLTNGVVMGIIYALSALGVSLVVGIMNVINFAHGEIYVLAGYFSALFSVSLGIPPLVAIPMAVAGVFLFALVVEWAFIRHTYGNEMKSLIITFIFSIVLQNAYLLVFGPYPKKPPNWVGGASHVFGMFFYSNQRLLSMLAAVGIIAGFFLLLHKTWFGRVMRAVSMDREVSAMMGINPTRVNQISFGIGCALAAMAGVILTPIFPVTPTVSVGVSLTAFVVVVLGGMGSFVGCVAGGLILGIVENLGAAYVASDYKHVFGFIILITVLLLRPVGLFGQKRL